MAKYQMIIDDYKAIALRQRQIAIQEGTMLCPTCKSVGYYEYSDEEGAIYWTVCTTCNNPMQRPPPTATAYQG